MQSAAAPELVKTTYLPAAHPMHSSACAPEYFPAAQLMHESIVFALSLALRLLPAVQLLQKLFPPSSWYLPASHDMQSSA